LDENNLTEEKKISVVTVCRNAESCIEETVQSVLSQSFDNFEYLVIDGASTDHTMQILGKYEEQFNDKGIRFFCISEPDKGIYDAMNKSLNHAHGEWILFMNSGDSFFDGNVLTRVFESDCTSKDVIYGDVVLKENDMYKKAVAGSITDKSIHSPICHQGTIIKTRLMKEFRFDTDYKLAADYDLLIRLYKAGCAFQKTDVVFAVFELGGTSSKQSLIYLSEMNRSRKSNEFETKESRFFSVLRLRTYNFVRSVARHLFKALFYSERFGWYSDKNKAGQQN
jgi:glycosyltransferase involved in cell wall biosynthesis